MSAEIEVGDAVTHKVDNWDEHLTVKKIVRHRNGPVREPIAFFDQGGFWRVSQLRKVNQ